MKRILSFTVAVFLMAQPAWSQRAVTGVTLDTIRVGDPFRAVVRVDVAPGTAVVLPDSLTAVEDLENAGKVRTRRDSTAQGVSVVAAYPLTAWRPGALALPALNVVINEAGEERSLAIDLPVINVVSVLPADTTSIQPKPLKDVLGPNRIWWPWLLAALLLLAALAAAYWWWRRRRRKEPAAAPLPVIMPRERALEELERIRKLGLLEQQEFKRFYSLISEVLRSYMAGTERQWSTDLTTDELAQRTRGTGAVAPAISVLRSSDYVKFARATATQKDATAVWEKARAWISAFPPAPSQQEAA